MTPRGITNHLYLLDIIGQTGVEDIQVAMRTVYEDLPILRIIINFEAVQSKHQTVKLVATTKNL